jgi:methylmalonyl-CoA/ethylmalonyl-CoA epimerase
LGLSVDHREELPEQETIVAMLPVGATELELVQPTTDTSGMARFLARRGPGLHHICFKVDNIETTLAELKARGIRLIHDEPIAGAGGRKVAFVHPKSACGVLVELVE